MFSALPGSSSLSIVLLLLLNLSFIPEKRSRVSAVSQGFTTSLLGPVRNKLDQSTSSVVFEIQGVQSGAIEEQRRGLSLVSLFFLLKRGPYTSYIHASYGSTSKQCIRFEICTLLSDRLFPSL